MIVFDCVIVKLIGIYHSSTWTLRFLGRTKLIGSWGAPLRRIPQIGLIWSCELSTSQTLTKCFIYHILCTIYSIYIYMYSIPCTYMDPLGVRETLRFRASRHALRGAARGGSAGSQEALRWSHLVLGRPGPPSVKHRGPFKGALKVDTSRR